MAQANRSKESSRSKFIILIQASLLIATFSFQTIKCEPKDFDWSDLGVSLSGPKSTYNGSNNNLRILLSPQRRMTSKSYEIDYSNSSHPTFGETSYVIPGSGSSGYSSQSGHNSAYSALSASLATLKNRLNARSAVSLNSQLADANSQSTGLYPSSASSYGSPLTSDSQSQQAQQQHTSQTQTQTQSQPTYLSVSHQDQQSSGYGAVQNQSSDNKTIVLAIPAKINFLTDGRTASKQAPQQLQQQQQQQQQQQHQLAQQQQQPQQLTVIQTAGDQAIRPEYGSTGGGQDGLTLDQASAPIVGSDQQDHHQYVLVNSPHASPPSSSGHHSNEHVAHYQGAYQTTVQQAPMAVKYIPTYQPVAAVQPKHYAPVEHQVSAYSDAQPASDAHMYGRYNSCLDTCNSADPRWRKYTVSKYKYCCSLSAQYDPQFEVPSAEKLGESAKQADDAYYNYLYRRTRSRRSRRPTQRYSRYNRYASNSPAAGGDDAASGNEGGGRLYESPYMKYYKSRSSQQHDAPEITREVHDSSVTIPSGKYGSKERSYRRGRSRDFDSPEPSQATYDTAEDESSYPEPTSTRVAGGYGNSDYSVESGRYPLNEGRSSSGGSSNNNDDDEARPTYADEPLDTEVSGKGADGSSDYQADSGNENPQNEDGGDHENVPSYKYSSSRRKKPVRGRQRKTKHGKQESKYHSKKNGRKPKHAKQEQSSSQTNGTDYESSGQSNNEQYRNADSGSADDDQQTLNRDPAAGGDTGSENDRDKDGGSLVNKFKASLNESTVVNLSKTTMHLKEILSMLEKKTHLRLNESSASEQQQQQPSSTSTPAPMTTTNLYPYSFLGSQFSSPSLQALSSDYLASEINLKSPYRFETSHLAPSLALPSTYNSAISLDAYSALPNFATSHYAGLAPQKQLQTYGGAGHQPPRKRRINKNVRYNNLMMPKTHGLGGQSSMMHHHGPNKHPFLNTGYYSSLHYPYWYTRNTSPSITNSYPYRNKNSYPSLLNGPVSSKLAAAASSALHNDESRLNGATNYDPLTNVASSLRPTSAMRLRSKPFVYQPHVLPIYTRHTILTQPLDSTK